MVVGLPCTYWTNPKWGGQRYLSSCHTSSSIFSENYMWRWGFWGWRLIGVIVVVVAVPPAYGQNPGFLSYKSKTYSTTHLGTQTWSPFFPPCYLVLSRGWVSLWVLVSPDVSCSNFRSKKHIIKKINWTVIQSLFNLSFVFFIQTPYLLCPLSACLTRNVWECGSVTKCIKEIAF